MPMFYLISAPKIDGVSPIASDQMDMVAHEYFGSYRTYGADALTEDIINDIIADVGRKEIARVTPADVVRFFEVYRHIDDEDEDCDTRLSRTEWVSRRDNQFYEVLADICTKPDVHPNNAGYWLLTKDKFQQILSRLQQEKQKRVPNFEADCLAAELFGDAEFWMDNTGTVNGAELNKTIIEFTELLSAIDFDTTHLFFYQIDD